MKKSYVYVSILISFILIISLFSIFAANFDLNGDGVVNRTDIANLAELYRGKGDYNASYDFNNDSEIDLFDLVLVARNISLDSGSVQSSEPFYGDDVSDVLIKQETFEDYDYLHSGLGSPYLFGSGAYWNIDFIAPGSDYYAYQALDLTEGRDNSHAYRQDFGTGQGLEISFYKHLGTARGHFFFSSYFKTTAGWNPTNWDPDDGNEGIKGWMFYDSSARSQWGPGKIWSDPETCNNSYWPFPAIPGLGGGGYARRAYEGRPGNCGNMVWTGRIDDWDPPPWEGKNGTAFESNALNDGAYHRITFEHKSTGSPQYKKIWIDGILVWDDTPQNLTYPPINAVKMWGNYAMGYDLFDTYYTCEAGSIWFDEITMWERT